MSNLFDIDRISAAQVMVVGCGALGNEVLKDLVMSGVKHITIVDYDKVEERNLSHSILFRRADMGSPKVLAAQRTLLDIDPTVDIMPIEGNIQYHVPLGVLRTMDVVIACVDNRWARYCINRLCMRVNIPWVDGGIAYLDGTVRIFAPGENCYACSIGPEGHKELKRQISCADIAHTVIEDHHAPTTIIAASIIAAVQVQEALKIIENKGRKSNDKLPTLLGRMFSYDGEALTARFVRFKAWDDGCPVHECWSNIINVDFDVNITVVDALWRIRQLVNHDEMLSMRTTDFVFVDYVEHRITGEDIRTMCPSYSLQEKLPKGANIDDYLVRSYDGLDNAFPYGNKRLSDIGFLPKSVIRVTAPDQKDIFIQLK